MAKAPTKRPTSSKTAKSAKEEASSTANKESKADGSKTDKGAEPKAGEKSGAAKKKTFVRKQSKYPPTRRSLIGRLENWEDRGSWDEFFRIYSQFVFRVACKAGLSEAEANDVVQETFIRVAKNLREGKFCHDKGSFKAWLMNQTRWRIMDQFRGRSKDLSASFSAPGGEDGDRRTAMIENFADPEGDKLERVWNAEWNNNVTDIALRAVKGKVSPLQYQIFSCYVIKEWSVNKVMDHLGVSATQVYLAKHRVGRVMRKEIEKLDGQDL